MSLIGPSGPSTRGRRKGGKGGAGKRNENNKIYAHSLPLIFPEPESGGAGAVKSVLGLLGLGRPSVSNPHCEGIFDSATRSVWVVKREHVMILWRRGFFGKGDLSRTEPTWLTRQINERMATARGGEYHFIDDHGWSDSPMQS
jgi:tRNA-splicing endonuclease subunit Sen2